MKLVDKCVFCKIVRKEVFAAVFYKDDEILAFMDIRSVKEGNIYI